MAHDVFISYSSEDKAVADAVCASLENRKIRCWIAPRDVLPGIPYAEALIEGLNQSRILVLVFSANSNKSPQVMREVERAVNKGIPILPFRIENVMPSKSMEYFLSAPHWLDAMTPPLEQHLRKLTDTVQMLLPRNGDLLSDLKKQKLSATSASEYELILDQLEDYLKINPGSIEAISLKDELLAAIGQARNNLTTVKSARRNRWRWLIAPGAIVIVTLIFLLSGRLGVHDNGINGAYSNPNTPPTLAPVNGPGSNLSGTSTPDIPATSTAPAISIKPTSALSTQLTKTKILFSSTSELPSGIYSVFADGFSPTRLTDKQSDNSSPAWSPDGKKIAFVSTRDGHSEIYLMNADGSNQVRLTNSPAPDTSPAWSPDGKKIAFVSNRDQNEEIYIVNPDGTGLVRLTYNTAEDTSPAWSPDGTKIVFISNRDGSNNAAVYIMDSNGRNPTRLVGTGSIKGSVAWSPDGSRIAYDYNDLSSYPSISVIKADGSGQAVQLTKNNGADWYPSWSPDSSKIAFVEGYTLNIINADGSGQTPLINTFQVNGPPAWSPFLQ